MFFSKGLGGEKPPNERGASKEFDFLLLPPKKKGMSNDTWEKSEIPCYWRRFDLCFFSVGSCMGFLFLELTGRSYKYKGWKMICSFRAMPGMSGVQGCL